MSKVYWRLGVACVVMAGWLAGLWTLAAYISWDSGWFSPSTWDAGQRVASLLGAGMGGVFAALAASYPDA